MYKDPQANGTITKIKKNNYIYIKEMNMKEW